MGTIPGTAADFLQFLARLKPSPHDLSTSDAADTIERDLLHGRIAVEDGEPRGTITFRPDGFSQAWPIEAAATSAAELAPFLLYLRYEASSRDLVFIDEPEAHLHPSNQVALARALVQASRYLHGISIATHSEFLVSELSNLMMETAANEAKLGQRGIPVGVYEFQVTTPKKGVVVRALEFSPDEGFQVDEFAAVADQVFDRALALHETLHDGESDASP